MWESGNAAQIKFSDLLSLKSFELVFEGFRVDPEEMQLFSSSTVSALTPQFIATSDSNHPSQSTPSSFCTDATNFSQLGIATWMVRTIEQLGIRRPTLIQSASIPRLIAGDHVVGKAKTGSGKTAAFALPMLQCLSNDPYGVFSIVVTPTRFV